MYALAPICSLLASVAVAFEVGTSAGGRKPSMCSPSATLFPLWFHSSITSEVLCAGAHVYCFCSVFKSEREREREREGGGDKQREREGERVCVCV